MARRVVPGALTKAYTQGQTDFSPDLVGYQFTKSSSLFTLGNFSITTNVNPIAGEIFNTCEFSDFYTLETLDLTQQQSEEIESKSSTLEVKLKYDKRNFLNYVFFGESRNFVEKEVLDIIAKWKGGIVLNPNNINNTVVNFYYDQDKDESFFKFSIYVISNPYGLLTENVAETGNGVEINDAICVNINNYEIQNDYGKFDIIGYTGNTSSDYYVKLKVKGLAWPNLQTSGMTSGQINYILKPKDKVLDYYFFDKLNDFQNHLLNRLITPKYTAVFNVPETTEQGYTFGLEKKFTWPTSDGYNLDFNGRDYFDYLRGLLELSSFLDKERTNVMTRRLVSSSILEFDTPPGDAPGDDGRKVAKLLKIWGSEYDVIKRYIDGISFANTVTYDGYDNTADELIKMIAKNLGFDTIQTFSDNDLINYLAKTSNIIFSGESRSLSIQEMDTELWKRMVINAWWLFRSKGTRKVIEFLLNLFNIKECLIDLNEYVYVAKDKLDYEDVFESSLGYFSNILGLGLSGPFNTPESQLEGTGTPQIDNAFNLIEKFPIDTDGYPLILPNTPDYYFQMDGFWYNGGEVNNTKPNVVGNNPHFGPYDFGRAYFNKFTCFIDNFTPITSELALNTLTFNYFTDYTLGSVEGSLQQIITIDNNTSTTETNGEVLPDYGDFYAGVMTDDFRITGATISNAGTSTETSNTGTKSFKISFRTGDIDQCFTDFCPQVISFGTTGKSNGKVTYVENNVINFLNEECCTKYGYYNYYNNDDNTTECYWCPPKEYFIETPIVLSTEGVSSDNGGVTAIPGITNTEYMFELQDGTLVKPSKSCCTLRGYAWNNITGRCVKKEISTGFISNDQNVVL